MTELGETPADEAGPASPSRPVRGALAVALLGLGYLILLGYVWGPLPGQAALGRWNYVLGAAPFVLSETLMKAWRGFSRTR